MPKFLNDPREETLRTESGAGYYLEQDNNEENENNENWTKWNSKVLDLCDLPVDEYMKPMTVFAEGGGGGEADNYDNLQNKPSINGVTLQGNKTSEELGLSTWGSIGGNIDNQEDLNEKFVRKDMFLNKLFPTGCLYLMYTKVNPSTFIGGEWELVDEGYYPVATVKEAIDEQNERFLQAKLPKMTGSFTVTGGGNAHFFGASSGVFKDHGKQTNYYFQRSDHRDSVFGGYDFDSSIESGSVYTGEKTEVRPKSVLVYIYKRVDSGQLTYNFVNVSFSATDFNVTSAGQVSLRNAIYYYTPEHIPVADENGKLVSSTVNINDIVLKTRKVAGYSLENDITEQEIQDAIKDLTATLTNKTIDADDNTISNIETDNFKDTALAKSTDNVRDYDNSVDTKLTTEKFLQKTLHNIETPEENKDAVNKKYVDDALEELSGKVLRFKGFISATAPTGTLSNNVLWYEGNTLPTTFPMNVKTYDSTTRQWSTTTSEYTPDTLDLWLNLNDEQGYYWFGNMWSMIDDNGRFMYVSTFNGVVGNVSSLYYLDTGYDSYEVGFYRFIPASGSTPSRFEILDKELFRYVSTFTEEKGDTDRLYYLDTEYGDYKKGFYRYVETIVSGETVSEFVIIGHDPDIFTDVEELPESGISKNTIYRLFDDYYDYYGQRIEKDDAVLYGPGPNCIAMTADDSGITIEDENGSSAYTWVEVNDVLVQSLVTGQLSEQKDAYEDAVFFKVEENSYDDKERLIETEDYLLYHNPTETPEGFLQIGGAEEIEIDYVTIEKNEEGKIQANAILDVYSLPTENINPKTTYRIFGDRYLEDGDVLPETPKCYIHVGLNVIDENGITDTGVNPPELYTWDVIDDDEMDRLIRKRIIREVDAELMAESECFGTKPSHFVYKTHVTFENVCRMYHNPTATINGYLRIWEGPDIPVDEVTTEIVDNKIQANAVIEVTVLPTENIKENTLYETTETVSWEEHHYAHEGEDVVEVTSYKLVQSESTTIEISENDGIRITQADEYISWDEITESNIESYVNCGQLVECEFNDPDRQFSGYKKDSESEWGYDYKAKVTDTPTTETFSMTKLFRNRNGQWKSVSAAKLTEEQYSHLTSAQKTDGTVYLVDSEYSNAIIDVDELPTEDIKTQSLYRANEHVHKDIWNYYHNGEKLNDPPTNYYASNNDVCVIDETGVTIFDDDGNPVEQYGYENLTDADVSSMMGQSVPYIKAVDSLDEAEFCRMGENGYDWAGNFTDEHILVDFYMPKIFERINDTWVSHSTARLTEEEYGHLTESQKYDGTTYIVKEGHDSLIDFNYDTLLNKPSINYVTIEGNKTWNDLGIPKPIMDVNELPSLDIEKGYVYRLTEYAYKHGEDNVDDVVFYKFNSEGYSVDSEGIHFSMDGEEPVDWAWSDVNDEMVEGFLGEPQVAFISEFDDAEFGKYETDGYDHIGNFTRSETISLYHNPSGESDKFIKIGGGSDASVDEVTTEIVDDKIQANAVIKVTALPTENIKENSMYQYTENISYTVERYTRNGVELTDPLFFKAVDPLVVVVSSDGITYNPGDDWPYGSFQEWDSITQEYMDGLSERNLVTDCDVSEATFCQYEPSKWDWSGNITYDPVTKSFSMEKIFKRISDSWVSTSVINLTREHYEALPSQSKNDGTLYVVDDTDEIVVDMTYKALEDKPSVNDVTLDGSLTLGDLGIYSKEEVDSLLEGKGSVEFVNQLPQNPSANTWYYSKKFDDDTDVPDDKRALYIVVDDPTVYNYMGVVGDVDLDEYITKDKVVSSLSSDYYYCYLRGRDTFYTKEQAGTNIDVYTISFASTGNVTAITKQENKGTISGGSLTFRGRSYLPSADDNGFYVVDSMKKIPSISTLKTILYEAGKVDDVKLGGTSIVSNKSASIKTMNDLESNYYYAFKKDSSYIYTKTKSVGTNKDTYLFTYSNSALTKIELSSKKSEIKLDSGGNLLATYDGNNYAYDKTKGNYYVIDANTVIPTVAGEVIDKDFSKCFDDLYMTPRPNNDWKYVGILGASNGSTLNVEDDWSEMLFVARVTEGSSYFNLTNVVPKQGFTQGNPSGNNTFVGFFWNDSCNCKCRVGLEGGGASRVVKLNYMNQVGWALNGIYIYKR